MKIKQEYIRQCPECGVEVPCSINPAINTGHHHFCHDHTDMFFEEQPGLHRRHEHVKEEDLPDDDD